MTISYFQTLTLEENATADLGRALRQQFCDTAVPVLLNHAEIDCVSVFAPKQAKDPFSDDGAPPELVFQFDVRDIAVLATVFNDSAVHAVLSQTEHGSYCAEIFEASAFDIAGVATPEHRTASLSFNVRYYAPVDDPELFVDFYLKNHPQILAELPGIRNVFCYQPVAAPPNAPVALSNCILGNEVVFDNIAALNASMQTEVRQRLRADYNAFPVRPGPNSHYAMQRQDFRRAI